jgi:hypothetical protein
MKAAVGRIQRTGWTVYKASKEHKLPPPPKKLLRKVFIPHPANEVHILKKLMPFNLTPEDEAEVHI